MSARHSLRSRLVLSASLLALPAALTGGFSTAASAQNVQDEIIVTATRRAESVQDIPINISAIGGEEIAQQGFDDLSELSAFVPGLNIADQGGRDGNRIVVRGLNVENIAQNFGQANGGGTVATYVGEIPLYVDLRLNDLERVEVLLGPQGTLYGSGTMGGAIRYIPAKPKFDSNMMELRTDAYSYSEGSGISTDTGLTFNAAISDTFAVRGSVDFQADKGFVDYPYVVQQPGFSEPDPNFSDASATAANFRPLSDANTEDIFSGRIAARWNPIDAVDATLTYYFQDGDFGGRNTSSFRTGTIPADEYEYGARVAEPAERTDDLLALEVTADLGFAELTSASGIGGTKFNGQRDQTDLLITLEYYYEFYPTFTAFTFEDEETDILNQELRLVSKGDGPLSWIVGAFYNENEFKGLSTEFTPGVGAFNADFGFRQDLNDLEYFATNRSKLKEKALFGELGYEITDAWQVTLGARVYEYDLSTADQTEFPYFTTAADFTPYTLDDVEDRLTLAPNQSFNDELFKINTSYDFGDYNLYATFSQGFRVGAANAGEACPDVFVPGNQALCLLSPGQQFGPNAGDVAVINERDYLPDTVDNYELGAKGSFLDGALRLNGSVFFMDWKDPQVGTISVNAGTSITVNAGAAETKGVELSGDWDVTDNFNLRGAFSYTNAELTEGVESLVTTIGTTGGFGTVFENGEEGDRLPGSPETQFSVFGSYDYPLANGNNVFVNGGYAWQGDVLQTVGQRGGSIVLPSYGRANLSVGYEADNWSIIGYVDNLFDDFSESSAFSNPRFSQTIEGSNVRYFRTNVLPPRTIGARLRYRFQ